MGCFDRKFVPSRMHHFFRLGCQCKQHALTDSRRFCVACIRNCFQIADAAALCFEASCVRGSQDLFGQSRWHRTNSWPQRRRSSDFQHRSHSLRLKNSNPSDAETENGSLSSNEEERQQRWQEHVLEVLGGSLVYDSSCISTMPRNPVEHVRFHISLQRMLEEIG